MELLRKQGTDGDSEELKLEFKRRAGGASGEFLCNPALLGSAFKASHTVDLHGNLHRQWKRQDGLGNPFTT